jgi:hypothetical protein
MHTDAARTSTARASHFTVGEGQTRGGVNGGAVGLERKLKLASTAARSATGTGLTVTPETIVPEKLKHLSAQPAMDDLAGLFDGGCPRPA